MLRWLVLVVFVLPIAACAPDAPPRTPLPESALGAQPPVAPPSARNASACRAAPSTVYGSEPVVFHVEAASPGAVELTLSDERRQVVEKATLTAPGEFRPAELPSGDFTLRAGAEGASCAVTVNRELSRASQASR